MTRYAGLIASFEYTMVSSFTSDWPRFPWTYQTEEVRQEFALLTQIGTEGPTYRVISGRGVVVCCSSVTIKGASNRDPIEE
jgi:hypothetical protein